MFVTLLRTAMLAIALCAATAPAALVAAQEYEAEEQVAEEVDAEHHHGAFYTTTEFWAAVINFSLLLLVLRKLAAKPLSNYLVDRRRLMERTMTEAAEMRKKAEALHQEYTARLAQLDAELGKLRQDIARAAEDDKKQIVADAEETARRLRRETESLIEQHAQKLSAGVRREVVEASVNAAEQILRSALNPSDQQRLADVFKQEIKGHETDDGHGAAERRPHTAGAEGTP